jgi:hypothetical protein
VGADGCPPDHEDAFDLIPPELDVRAVVTWRVAPTEDGLRVEFHVYRDEDDDRMSSSPRR